MRSLICLARARCRGRQRRRRRPRSPRASRRQNSRSIASRGRTCSAPGRASRSGPGSSRSPASAARTPAAASRIALSGCTLLEQRTTGPARSSIAAFRSSAGGEPARVGRVLLELPFERWLTLAPGRCRRPRSAAEATIGNGGRKRRAAAAAVAATRSASLAARHDAVASRRIVPTRIGRHDATDRVRRRDSGRAARPRSRICCSAAGSSIVVRSPGSRPSHTAWIARRSSLPERVFGSSVDEAHPRRPRHRAELLGRPSS